MEPMTAELAIGTALGAVFLLGASWRGVQVWQDATADLDGWPRGVLRGLPAMMATAWASLAPGLAAAALGDDGGAGTALALIAGAGFLCGVALTVSVMLTGRPAALVPPHLRGGSQRRRERAAAPVRPARGVGEVTFRHRSQVLVAVFLAVVVGLSLAFLVLAILESPGLRLAGLAVAAALFAVFVLRDLRPMVRITRDALLVRNRGPLRRIPWGDVDGVDWAPGEGRRPPRATLRLRGGEVLGLVALEGTHVQTEGFRRWSQESAADLGRAITERR